MARGRPFRPWAIVSLSANQTSNLAVNNHIEFDSLFEKGGLVTLSSGGGQLNGIITLAQGWYYQIWNHLTSSSMTNAEVIMVWRDHPADTSLVGVTGLTVTQILTDMGAASDAINHGDASIVLDCTGAGATIKVDKTAAATGTQNNWQAGCHVFIEALR